MDIQKRAETFTKYVGLELKGAIVARGYSATAVAQDMGRSAAAFNRWLNGKASLPLTVLAEACERIGIDPTKIVEAAYDRLCNEQGERDGYQYEDGMAASAATAFGANVTPLRRESIDASNIDLTEADELRYAADTSPEYEEPDDA